MRFFKKPGYGEEVVRQRYAYLPTRVRDQKGGKELFIWLENYTEERVYQKGNYGDYWKVYKWVNYRPWEERFEEAKRQNKIRELYKKGY